MFCNQCGHQNPPDANFCSSCGSPLEITEADDPTITFTPVEGSSDPAEEEFRVDFEGVPEGTGVLVTRRGDTVGTRFVLDQQRTTAGRAPESDILLDDITVSRQHVVIIRDSSTYRLSDVGSLNGTYLNRELLKEDVELRPGDEIQIGKFKMVFVVVGSDEETAL